MVYMGTKEVTRKLYSTRGNRRALPRKNYELHAVTDAIILKTKKPNAENSITRNLYRFLYILVEVVTAANPLTYAKY